MSIQLICLEAENADETEKPAEQYMASEHTRGTSATNFILATTLPVDSTPPPEKQSSAPTTGPEVEDHSRELNPGRQSLYRLSYEPNY
jgi:hypothetical protein